VIAHVCYRALVFQNIVQLIDVDKHNIRLKYDESNNFTHIKFKVSTLKT
jgi:hypothetical protein